MVESKKNGSHARLWAVLCGLVTVIIGLVIAVVMVNSNGGTSGEEVASQEDLEVIIPDETMEQWEEEYNAFNALFEDAAQRARSLLGENPPDVNGVYELYDTAIDEYVSQSRFDYAWAFVQGERDVLSEAGLNNEAFQAMTRVSYGMFPTPMQYECYVEVLKLAKSLNDGAAVEKYEKLVAETKDAWESVQKATEEAAREFESELESGDAVE